MDWLELKILIDGKDTERAENIVNMAVPYGFYLEDYSDIETHSEGEGRERKLIISRVASSISDD